MNVSAYIMVVFSIIVELKDQIQKENIMEMFSHLSPTVHANNYLGQKKVQANLPI